jgi:K+-sensing histidine kinase KdpD
MSDRAVPEPARERDAQLAELVVILAHDFKNALAALTANLHYLDSSLSESGDPDSVEALSDSVTLCQVLDHFLRNLDLLGRYESVVAHRTLTSLRAVASDAIGRFQRHAKASGVHLALADGKEGSDALAFIDRDLFLRAAENLVANAVENAPKGSRVMIEIEGSERESSLTVIDSRDAPPPALLRPSVPPSVGQRPAEGHRGRGLGIFCADVAARAGGGQLERSGRPGECRLRLIAPSRDARDEGAPSP